MPAPIPSMPASVGASPGTVVIVEAQSRRREAEPDAGEGDEQRVAGRPGAAQDDEQQDHRDEQAGDLADGEAAGRGRRRTTSPANAACAPAGRTSRRGLEAVRGCGAELFVRLVVAHGRGGGAPVGRGLQPRRRRRAAGVRFGGAPTVDGAAAEIAGEHDGGLRSRLGGEAGFEQVLCLLGLDARDGEVVLEAGSGGDRARDQGDDRKEDGEGDAAGSAPVSARRVRRACAAE